MTRIITHGNRAPHIVHTGYKHQSNPSAQFEREQERPLNLWIIIAMPLIAALFLATVSLLSGGHERSAHETGLCSESCR